MAIQHRNNRKGVPNFRLMLDYFMAGLMICAALFILFSEKLLGYDYFANSPFLQGSMRWVVAGLFIVYGLFRVYRANLFRKSQGYNEE